MAVILSFAQARRVDLVRSISQRMTELGPDTAERHLVRQVQIQRDTIGRKGVAPDLVEEERSAPTFGD